MKRLTKAGLDHLLEGENSMSLICFDGAKFEGEKIAVRASTVVALATHEETGHAIIMFRVGDNTHNVLVKHPVQDVFDAINTTMDW